MTREEAIETLKENSCAVCAYGSQSMISCDIRGCDNRDAIKALEQEPCSNCCNGDQIEKAKLCQKSYLAGMEHKQESVLDKIRAEIADLDDVDYDYQGYYKAVTDAVKIIDKYRAESEVE